MAGKQGSDAWDTAFPGRGLRGTSWLLPEQLCLRWVGPGQPDTHCVWRGTSPETRKPSFRAWAKTHQEYFEPTAEQSLKAGCLSSIHRVKCS